MNVLRFVAAANFALICLKYGNIGHTFFHDAYFWANVDISDKIWSLMSTRFVKPVSASLLFTVAVQITTLVFIGPKWRNAW